MEERTERLEMCAMVLEPPKRLGECIHAETEVLGFDGNTEFHRCRACGQVIIGQIGRFWILRPIK